MMSKWLCDTNVVSELMRRSPNPYVVEWASAQDHFNLSVITVEEISCGLEQKQLTKKKAWFDRFMGYRCSIISTDESIATRAGQERGRFLRLGAVRTQADILIAATAWKYNLTVVTRNTRDFTGCGIPLLDPFERAGS